MANLSLQLSWSEASAALEQLIEIVWEIIAYFDLGLRKANDNIFQGFLRFWCELDKI